MAAAKPTAPISDGPRAQERMAFQLNLRRRGISDQNVLRAMDSVPREMFVDANAAHDAYLDTALPIACGQTISQPFVVAYMTEQLRLDGRQRVLEIGTGSGYQTAVLARLAHGVVTIERYRTLSELARRRLDRLGCDNVECLVGDGFAVPEEIGTFDRILVTAAMETLPDALLEVLNEHGVLIAPVGPHDGVQKLVRITKVDGEPVREELLDVRFVPMLAGIAREM
jgi:protein-L-isoaspartate(D-aspartate) O-methyltransferase